MGTIFNGKDGMPPPSQDSRARLHLVREARGESKNEVVRQPTPALDDSELLAALRAGDRTAATAMHDRARPIVDRTIRKLLGASDRDHEDLAQQAMIELVFTIDRFRGDCSLDSWISTLSAHCVYKLIRKRSSERRLFDAVAVDTFEAASPTNVSRDLVSRGLIARVVEHLAALDAAKAWAYVLHDVCGYDLVEISKITGVSVAAAQSRLVRGRREIEERIAADPDLANALFDRGSNE